VMAVNNRSLRSLRTNLEAAKDVEGKPFKRDILKAAENTIASIELEIIAEEAIKSRKTSEVKLKLSAIETILKERPELAKQDGSKIQRIQRYMVDLIKSGEKISRMTRYLQHYINLTSTKAVPDVDTIEELQQGIMDAKELLKTSAEYDLEAASILSDNLVESQSCLKELKRLAEVHQIKLQRLHQQEEQRKREAEERAARKREEGQRRIEDAKREAEADKLRADVERLRKEAKSREAEQQAKLQERIEEDRKRQEAMLKKQEDQMKAMKEQMQMMIQQQTLLHQKQIERLREEREREPDIQSERTTATESSKTVEKVAEELQEIKRPEQQEHETNIFQKIESSGREESYTSKPGKRDQENTIQIRRKSQHKEADQTPEVESKRDHRPSSFGVLITPVKGEFSHIDVSNVNDLTLQSLKDSFSLSKLLFSEYSSTENKSSGINEEKRLAFAFLLGTLLVIFFAPMVIVESLVFPILKFGLLSALSREFFFIMIMGTCEGWPPSLVR